MQKIAVIGDIHYQLVRLKTVLEALAQIEELDGVLLVGAALEIFRGLLRRSNFDKEKY